MSSFVEAVHALVRSVPAGRVTTYGTLARLLGRPRSARMVGWALHHCPRDVPAHRVVNHAGRLSGGWAFGHPSVQQALLEEEGVVFLDEAQLDLRRYGWPDEVFRSPAPDVAAD